MARCEPERVRAGPGRGRIAGIARIPRHVQRHRPEARRRQLIDTPLVRDRVDPVIRREPRHDPPSSEPAPPALASAPGAQTTRLPGRAPALPALLTTHAHFPEAETVVTWPRPTHCLSLNLIPECARGLIWKAQAERLDLHLKLRAVSSAATSSGVVLQ